MAARRRPNRPRARSTRKDPLARERALEALQLMRSRALSLTRAARRVGTTPRTVRKHVGGVLKRTRAGRWTAAPSDRLTRRVRFLTEEGTVEVAVRGSRAASEIARHMAAVDRFLRSGDTGPLSAFQGRSVRAGRETLPFLTDPEALARLANTGEVSFERLYSRRA